MNNTPIKLNLSETMLCAVLAVCMATFSSCSDDADNTGIDNTVPDDTASAEDGTNIETDPDRTDSSSDNVTRTETDNGNDSETISSQSGTSPADTDSIAPMMAELWYSVEDQLVHIALDETNGQILDITASPMSGLGDGQNSLTMLKNGGLVGARLRSDNNLSEIYYIATPPRDGGPADYVVLGNMTDDIMIEALYTDCDGRLYAMDTGVDNSTSEGNRLLIFTGDYMNGDFTYQVVSDWSEGSVADIDDMGPGINDAGEITDANGFAIDTGVIYAFNYEVGQGTEAGAGGTWGIHALGAQLFADNQPRLYVMDSKANIIQKDYQTFEDVGEAVQGPQVSDDYPFRGWSSLAGPLTDCVSEFTITVE